MCSIGILVEKDFLLNRLNIITQLPFHVLTSAKPWQAVTRKVNRPLSPPTLVILFARKHSMLFVFFILPLFLVWIIFYGVLKNFHKTRVIKFLLKLKHEIFPFKTSTVQNIEKALTSSLEILVANSKLSVTLVTSCSQFWTLNWYNPYVSFICIAIFFYSASLALNYWNVIKCYLMLLKLPFSHTASLVYSIWISENVQNFTITILKQSEPPKADLK